MPLLFGTFLLSYLLGSIPFGLLITRAAGLGDVRKIGSGNIGATNVMRTGHKGLGALTLLCDTAKGLTATGIAALLYGESIAAMAGFIAVLGHIFPVWLRLRGGKGVATALGVLLALSPPVTLAVCAMWLIVFAVTRVSSLAALIALGYSPIAAYLLADDVLTLLCFCLAALILFTHRGNIKRLLQGNEGSFQRKKR